MAVLKKAAAFTRRLAAAMPLLALAPAHAGPPEYEIKAAFIYQIARLVEWPANVDAPMRLCILGADPFGAALDSIRGRPVGARSLEVALPDAGVPLHECALLFVAAPAEKSLDRVVALSRGAGMLTIGDTEGFAQRGAMVNFFLDGDKVRFEINRNAVRQGGLRISSKLLSLARLVD